MSLVTITDWWPGLRHQEASLTPGQASEAAPRMRSGGDGQAHTALSETLSLTSSSHCLSFLPRHTENKVSYMYIDTELILWLWQLWLGLTQSWPSKATHHEPGARMESLRRSKTLSYTDDDNVGVGSFAAQYFLT